MIPFRLLVLSLVLGLFGLTESLRAQSLESELRKAKKPAERFVIYYKLASGSYQARKFKEAEKYYSQAYLQFNKIQTVRGKNGTRISLRQMNLEYGAVCDSLGSEYARRQRNLDALKFFRKSINPYQYSGNQEAVFEVTKKMAEINLRYKNIEKYDKAIKKYANFIGYNSIKKASLKAKAYTEIALLYHEKGAVDTASMTLDNAINRFKSIPEKLNMYREYFNFYARLAEKEGENQEGILNRASEVFESKIDFEENSKIKANLYLIKAEVEMKRGKRGNYFKDYTSAINLFKEEKDYKEVARICLHAGKTLFEAAEYKTAKTYIDEGLGAFKQLSKEEEKELRKTKSELAEIAVQIEARAKLLQLEGKTETLDEQLETQKRQRNQVALIGVSILLVLVIISFFTKQKANKMLARQNNEINEQKEQIEMQRDDIATQKNEIEESYRNITVLSEIGQKITSTLDLDAVIETVHECFSTLVNADRFGVAVLRKGKLEYVRFIQHNQNIKHVNQNINDFIMLKRCIENQEEVLVNDLSTEFPDFQTAEEALGGKAPQALILLPLIVNGKSMGMLTVQSYKKWVYSESNLVMLRTLASYTSIALHNANAYKIIETTNKHITDSIRYGETIQQAVLPTNEKLAESFKDFFVLFKPKDMVSGDFYWHTKFEDKTFVAAVDCTGHGVPGAFMSMIGNTLLNEIVNQNKVCDPARVLELLHVGIRKALRQSKEAGRANDDGMDLSLCVLYPSENGMRRVVFAGAKRPLWYLKPPYTEMEEIKGDRKSIGGLQREGKREFTDKELLLPEDSLLYLYSDGYPDQNNPEKKKFGSRRLKEFLLEISALPLNRQKERLDAVLAEHQGEAEQRDDITILAVKV